MSIRDVAESSGGPEIVLTADLPHRPAGDLQDEVKSADELTAEGQFPEFGRFMKVEVDGEVEWWEIAPGLADTIVEIADEAESAPSEFWLRVDRVQKSHSGEWRFFVTMEESKDSMN